MYERSEVGIVFERPGQIEPDTTELADGENAIVVRTPYPLAQCRLQKPA
jgi:hypothetical protein